MATPTDLEQLMLELVNRLRTDPHGEYDRLINSDDYAEISSAVSYFGVDLSALASQLAALSATHPLAWNEALHTAASLHNDEMIAQDAQQHVLPGEAGLGDRFEAAGYTGWNRIGENIYAYSRSPFYGHAGFVIDWGYDDADFDAGGGLRSDWKTRGDGIQDGAGHRVNLMSANFTEIGIAITEESDPNTDVGPYVITQDLGSRFSYSAQFVGSVIDDADDDDFYDIGEGMGGVTVTLQGGGNTYVTTTWASGGYQIEVPAGAYTITFTGGGLPGAIVVNETLGSVNVYVAVEADEASSEGVTRIGTAGDDTLNGTPYDDVIDGRGGIDTMRGGGGDDLYRVDNTLDVVDERSGEGVDTVIAGSNFRLKANVENLELTGKAGIGRGNALDNDMTAAAEVDTRLYGGLGADVLRGRGGADTLSGQGHKDVLQAGAGNDLLVGGSGGDRLYGQSGDDDLRGGTGKDLLVGGAGRDVLAGGEHGDRFVFDDGHFAGLNYSTADRIRDFEAAGNDVIDLAAVDANSAVGGDQAFAFIGNAAFSSKAGELRYTSNGINTLVQGDTDGDGIADFAIRLDGTIDLTADMFLL